jgi:hypothetical protein
MIPLTLALSLRRRGDYTWFLPLEGGGLGEGEMPMLFETVNKLKVES